MNNFFNQYLIQPFVFIFLFLFYYLNDAGLVIIVCSILLKVIFLPISYYSYLEEEKIKKVSKKINELTKDIKDFIKKSEIISKIYQEENLSPFKNFILQIINLPILIAFFIAIPQFLNKINDFYFLDIINLKNSNFFLGILVFLVQLIFIFYFSNQENKKMILFFISILAPIFFILPAGLLIYIFITQLFTILERKVIFTYQIKKTIIPIKKNNP